MIFLGNVEHSTTPPILQSQTSLQTSASRLCYKDPSGKVEACHRWQLFLPWQSLCVSPVWVRFIQPNILFPSCSMFAFLNGKAPPCPWLWMDDLYVRGCCGHWLVAFGTVCYTADGSKHPTSFSPALEQNDSPIHHVESIHTHEPTKISSWFESKRWCRHWAMTDLQTFLITSFDLDLCWSCWNPQKVVFTSLWTTCKYLNLIKFLEKGFLQICPGESHHSFHSAMNHSVHLAQ